MKPRDVWLRYIWQNSYVHPTPQESPPTCCFCAAVQTYRAVHVWTMMICKWTFKSAFWMSLGKKGSDWTETAKCWHGWGGKKGCCYFLPESAFSRQVQSVLCVSTLAENKAKSDNKMNQQTCQSITDFSESAGTPLQTASKHNKHNNGAKAWKLFSTFSSCSYFHNNMPHWNCFYPKIGHARMRKRDIWVLIGEERPGLDLFYKGTICQSRTDDWRLSTSFHHLPYKTFCLMTSVLNHYSSFPFVISELC